MRPVIRTVLCSIVLMLYAGTTMASAPPPPPAKKKDEKEGPVPGLTGAKLLRCEPGFYPSGNACKPARPGTYVPGGATFPVLCPKGTTSEAKSRSVGECVPVK
ncbi:MAG: hypothetical protein NTZ22_05360 [Hyphomicrobiales bacterium]|jgi:hypothetical protein|nr:hypothetical protein [Hyphomicrobiales bacterium]